MNDEPGETKNGWLKKIGALLGDNNRPQNPHRDFLNLLAHYRSKHTILSDDTANMMEALLDLGDTQVRDIMVPRGQIILIQENWPPEKVLDTIIRSGHSRHPVVSEENEEILGILISKDLLPLLVGGGENTRHFLEVMRPATLVPESKALDAMLRDFKTNRNHMALVIDEYGNLSGLITIEDVIEEIVGEIDDEHDEIPDADYRKIGENKYQIKALMLIEDFNREFGAKLPDDNADTLGGYVTHQLGRMPVVGDSMALDDIWRITVSKANQRRLVWLRLENIA